MIAILEKYEQNTDFHLIVDFVEASHIRYALTFNPTVYVYHIQQFWSTARIETTEEGTKILATVGGKLITISESSIRRNLKLNDEAGISFLPDAELFKNLTLMGYNISPNQKFTFQKGQFSHQWKYLIHTIMIAQSSVLPPVADEPASPLGDDSQACNLDEGEEAAEKSNNDTEEMVNVLTSLDAAIVLTSGVSVIISPVTKIPVAKVPTGSGSIPTASPPGTGVPTGGVPTGSGMVARELEKEMARDAQRMNEQIARDVEIARIHAEEELQMMIDGLDRNNETVAKMESKALQGDDTGRNKREVLEQKSAKKVKIIEEVSEEKLKEMMQLIPVEEENELWVELKRLYEPNVEDLLCTHTQNLMHALVEWKIYDMCGVHHVISKDQEMFLLVEKDYPLRKVKSSHCQKKFPLLVRKFPPAEDKRCHCQEDCTAIEDMGESWSKTQL
nr:hypothetical protein [Tanacetum cinerariifolium]